MWKKEDEEEEEDNKDEKTLSLTATQSNSHPMGPFMELIFPDAAIAGLVHAQNKS